MSCPTNCVTCKYEATCNSAMFMDGCHFFPPKSEKKTNLFLKLIGKFFK